MAEVLLEVCVDGARGLAAALDGGADRVELCSALSLGGLTPPPGLISLAATATVPVHVLIRPHAGGFHYDDADMAAMLGDILAVRAAGLDGVVIGAAMPDGRLERVALAEMVAAAGPMAVTLHRVFDLAPDWREALEVAVDLGIGRILTSGGAATALAGADRLAEIHTAAAGRIGILVCGGVSDQTIGTLMSAMPLREVHASCSVQEVAADALVAFGFSPGQTPATSSPKVRALKSALGAHSTLV